MAQPFGPFDNLCCKFNTDSLEDLLEPIQEILQNSTPLNSRGDRPLQLDFEHHLNILLYFHLEEFTSARALIQKIKEDNFARLIIAPPDGIEKS